MRARAPCLLCARCLFVWRVLFESPCRALPSRYNYINIVIKMISIIILKMTSIMYLEPKGERGWAVGSTVPDGDSDGVYMCTCDSNRRRDSDRLASGRDRQTMRVGPAGRRL